MLWMVLAYQSRAVRRPIVVSRGVTARVYAPLHMLRHHRISNHVGAFAGSFSVHHDSREFLFG